MPVEGNNFYLSLGKILATWVGLFVNNIDRGSVGVLEVTATSETEAVTKLDFYQYDQI